MSTAQLSDGWRRKLAAACVSLPLLIILLTGVPGLRENPVSARTIADYLAMGVLAWFACLAMSLTIRGVATTLYRRPLGRTAVCFVPWTAGVLALTFEGGAWVARLWPMWKRYDLALLATVSVVMVAFIAVLAVQHGKPWLAARELARREHLAPVTAGKESQEPIVMRTKELNDFAQSIIESAPVSMIATDAAGVIVAMNEAAERLTQYGKAELVGEHSLLMLHDATEMSTWAMQLSKETGEAVPAGFASLIARAKAGMAEERESTYIRKDGSRVWVNLTMTKLRTADARTAGYLAIAFDVTERKKLADSVAHMAHHDQLTGLPNRSVLNDRLVQGIERAKRFGQRMAIFVVDIDHFKRINDSLGHQGGDDLLAFVAKQLQAAVRQTDTVARVGGDEFVVVMQDFREASDAERCADLMLQKVATPVTIQGREVRVTASIGYCLYPEGAEDAAGMLRNADAAMYEAKGAGRAGRQSYSREMEKDASERLELEEDLRHALENREFSLNYQPQVDCVSGRVTGMESLLRWESKKRGRVAPADFIPVAEEIGLMGPIGEWTLAQSCRDCAEMQREMGRKLTVAVNLSARQLSQKTLAGLVAKTLASSGLAANQLELEITEQMLMVNSASTLETLQAIRELGVCIAIDDFGTGFSSLSYILQYHVDRIKIDRSFVEKSTHDPNAAAVVRTIIAMGHGLNMRVVAEGVETAEQYDFLLKRRCDDVQGFLFARPVGRKDFVGRARVIDLEQRELVRAGVA